MIKYSRIGLHKQLNEIVMVGSHDAGITGGGGNVQTQNLDVYLQATAGVRLFDLRIGATTLKEQHGLGKEAQLKAYHSAIKFGATKTRQLTDLARQVEVDRSKLAGGAWGMGLQKILSDAKKFIEQNSDEFLILKFDKCSNWLAIAEACKRFLGNTIHARTGNLNTKTLGELSGSVIVLFSKDGLEAVRNTYSSQAGILGIKNLSGGGSYDPLFDGMQYFGKGGTSVAKPFSKIGQNVEKQAKLMKKGGDGNADVMGMMYWTTTGVFESIKKRNDTMWTDSKVGALRKLWSEGLADSIESRLASNVDPRAPASGGLLKAFMPNIVMIDFADAEKCRTIYELNSVAATALTSAAQLADQKFGKRVRFS